MKNKIKAIIVLVGLTFIGQVCAEQPVWSASGLKMPESVEYDIKHDRYYASNINGGLTEQDGNGSIALLDSKGKLIDPEWVSGLHSPKGLALHKNRLYVADVKQLVVIDVITAKIISRYHADDSQVLNGITVSEGGKVYISDWFGNSIYTLDDGELIVWLANDALESPNGLAIDKDYIYVASWGENLKEDFTTEMSGSIKKISLASQKIETIMPERWVNLDGISLYGKDKWLVSDFINGDILLIDRQGKIEKNIKIKKGTADFYHIFDKKLLVVPLLFDNQVVAYKL
jgi:sugar lactone lactonase YvrE